MGRHLRHFGIIVDAITDGIRLEDAAGVVTKKSQRSGARTTRKVARGGRVKEKTWAKRASELVDLLMKSELFPLWEEDRARLVETLNSHRKSYEQLSDMVSRLNAPSDMVQRGVLHLAFLDLSFRYAALCLLEQRELLVELPGWANANGGNMFWKSAMEQRFPGLALLGSSKRDGDCALRLKINQRKMRRCCYENGFPGLVVLCKVFPEKPDRIAALRHYAAFHLCRTLESFGQTDIEYWVLKFLKTAKWLHSVLNSLLTRFSESERNSLLKRVMLGGAGEPMIQRFFRRLNPDRIPVVLRADLLAMAQENPVAAIQHFVDACVALRQFSPAHCWEEAFDLLTLDFDRFRRSGTLASGSVPSTKLQLVRILAAAQANKDSVSEEVILRRIINLDPLDAEAHQLLGQLCEKLGRNEDAWQEYELASALDGNFALPLFRLADSKSRAGLHEQCLNAIARIPDSGVGPGSRSYIAGICLMRANRPAEAIPFLKSAHEERWEPGTCAALLAHAYGTLQPDDRKFGRESKRWEKEAQHHGLSVDEVVRSMPKLSSAFVRNSAS